MKFSPTLAPETLLFLAQIAANRTPGGPVVATKPLIEAMKRANEKAGCRLDTFGQPVPPMRKMH